MRIVRILLLAFACLQCTLAGGIAQEAGAYLKGDLNSIAELARIDTNHPGIVKPDSALTNAAKWYNDSVFYHIWLDGFADSDGDGYGDLQGVLDHLDYLNDGKPDSRSSLGVTTLWLSPFFAANSRHRYDATSYYKVDQRLGDMDLLRKVVAEAHRRGMHVIFDMVPNHSSSRHPYFVNSRSGADALLRDFYVWTNELPPGWHLPWGSGDRSSQVWSRTTNGYYYHAFGANMPDLNFKNPKVVEEMDNVMRYYLNLGFDGIRLDAVRYLVEEDSTRSADAESSHQVLREFRKMAREYSGDRYLVGEVWTSADIVRKYFGNGEDELISCFNFQFAGSVADAIEKGDGSLLDGNLTYLCTNLPAGSFPANFLVNHDNAGSRSVTRYHKELRKVRLAVALNLLEWGTPYVYYGEEIGMEGLNGNDQNMRRPFLWKDAEAQVKDPNSLWTWHRNLIHVRLGNAALRHGSYRRISTGVPEVYAFIRGAPGSKVLCVFNLDTRETRQVTLNLATEFTRATYPLVGNNGQGPPGNYALSLNPGEVTVLSLDVAADRVCRTPTD